jgi:tetratricopeptide (TPR) repeat protein
MIPAYDNAWEDILAKAKALEFGEKHEAGDTFSNGHENFLQSAVYLYYYDGQETKARDYFKRAKEIYKDNPTSVQSRDGEYELSMPDFARVRFDDELGFQNVMLINRRIELAWQFGLAERSNAVMKRHLDAAKRTYEDFLEERQITSKADLDVQARQNIPPFEDLVLIQFIEMMASPQNSLPQKADTWRLAVPLLVAESDERALVFEAYVRMIPFLTSQAQLEGITGDIRNGFPVPPGFEEWYQQNVNQQPALPKPRQPSPTQ